MNARVALGEGEEKILELASPNLDGEANPIASLPFGTFDSSEYTRGKISRRYLGSVGSVASVPSVRFLLERLPVNDFYGQINTLRISISIGKLD